MAVLVEETPTLKKLIDQFLEKAPLIIRKTAERFPGNRLYRVKSTGSRGIIKGYAIDGTVTLRIDGTYCRVQFAYEIAGLETSAIEECDLPGPDEPTGVELTDPIKIKEYMDALGVNGIIHEAGHPIKVT